MAFPPRDPDMQHVVINQAAQEELSLAQGRVARCWCPTCSISRRRPRRWTPTPPTCARRSGWRPDDIIILQPTRVVPRKGIEHAIKLVQMLDDPRYKLVISHEAGDEGLEYRHMLAELAQRVGRRPALRRHPHRRRAPARRAKGSKVYTLWDLYPHADLVTYPSLYEGFGNAFLEAIYFRMPVLINRYSIFVRDIEPKGFRVPVMDGFVTREVGRGGARGSSSDAAYRRTRWWTTTTSWPAASSATRVLRAQAAGR